MTSKGQELRYLSSWCCTLTDVWEQRRPFPQQSVDGWRKDEFQWMSLALVGDRNDIQPQNLCTNYRSWNAFLLFIHWRRPFVSFSDRRTWWDGVRGWRDQGGNWPTWIHLEWRPWNWHMSVVCVCVCVDLKRFNINRLLDLSWYL